MTAKEVIFTGRVQGVGFRYVTKQLARGFDVIGWIRNLTDGTVALQIMGEGEEIDDFINEIVEESELASHIREFSASEIPPLENCRGFSIK
jgi:acylphosphatase